MPAQYRKGRVISAKAPANSHKPVTKITCGANGTQSGVILRSSPGTTRCPTPAATKNAARSQRMMARVTGNGWPAGRPASWTVAIVRDCSPDGANGSGPKWPARSQAPRNPGWSRKGSTPRASIADMLRRVSWISYHRALARSIRDEEEKVGSRQKAREKIKGISSRHDGRWHRGAKPRRTRQPGRAHQEKGSGRGLRQEKAEEIIALHDQA